MLYCLLQLEDSPIIRNQIMFAESNVKLEFDENYYEEVVEKAMKSGTGTRALNSIVKASISAAAFELLGVNHPSPKKVYIGKDCVSNPDCFVVE
jgi:ATP-dependent protease Clp ATPase subunit